MGVNFSSTWRESLDVRLYTKGESIALIMHSSPKISGSRRFEAFVLYTFWSLAELHVAWLLKLVQVKAGSLTAKATFLLGFGGGSCWKHSKRTSRVMDAHGHICTERALNKRGQEAIEGPEYRRSSPLRSIQVDASVKDKMTWVSEVRVHSGYLTFSHDSEDQAIKTCRSYCAVFPARTLEKVNNEEDGDSFIHQENFYPVLYTMLRDKQDWGVHLYFRGRSTFEPGVMEWTELILDHFTGKLDQAGIYGAVGVSRFPYHYCGNTWRAFCELWSPLTNTLHHGNGEMSVSLYDLKLIGGLPIMGVPYEEFIPANKELHRNGRYPYTIVELLRIHSELSAPNSKTYVSWRQWLAHFYRGRLVYAAYGEATYRGDQMQQNMFMGRKPALDISKEGELAAFLAFWLSRFVLPSNDSRIRPETFYMAGLMAQGVKVSLAPSVLGYIYHGLGEFVTDPRGPKESRGCLPVHYVIGWLGEHFTCLYRRRAASDIPARHPHLARYAGVDAENLDITSARLAFRSNESVDYRPSPYNEQKGCFLLDDKSLLDEQFEFLVCIRSTLLPLRMGIDLWLEPYYPNRFAQQFGFDQGVPSNKLLFAVEKRRQCCIEDLAKAQHILLRANTSARFYIPRSTYNGSCTWMYCRWWMRACAPYLGRSVSAVYLTLRKQPLEKRSNVFVIKSLREVSYSLRKEVLLTDIEEADSATHFRKSSSTGDNKRKRDCTRSDNSGGRNLKQAHKDERSDFDDVIADNANNLQKKHVPDKGTSSYGARTTAAKEQRVQSQDQKSTSKGTESNSKGTRPQIREAVLKLKELEPKPKPRQRESGPKEKHPETKVAVEEPSLNEPELKSLSGGNSNSPSKATEHIGSDTCSSQSFCEEIIPLVESPLSIYQIFSPNINEHRRDFIITEIQDILSKLSSSESPKEVLVHRQDINSTIAFLTSIMETLESGRNGFDWFAKTVDQIFELASQLLQGMIAIEKGAEIDVDLIQDLARRQEECQNAKKTLNMQLSDFKKELADLEATEKSVSEAEKQAHEAMERAKQLRAAFEAARESLEEKINDLEKSSEEHNQLDEELRQKRIQAHEDKLPEFEQVKASFKSRQEQFANLINSLTSFGAQSK